MTWCDVLSWWLLVIFMCLCSCLCIFDMICRFLVCLCSDLPVDGVSAVVLVNSVTLLQSDTVYWVAVALSQNTMWLSSYDVFLICELQFTNYRLLTQLLIPKIPCLSQLALTCMSYYLLTLTSITYACLWQSVENRCLGAVPMVKPRLQAGIWLAAQVRGDLS